MSQLHQHKLANIAARNCLKATVETIMWFCLFCFRDKTNWGGGTKEDGEKNMQRIVHVEKQGTEKQTNRTKACCHSRMPRRRVGRQRKRLRAMMQSYHRCTAPLLNRRGRAVCLHKMQLGFFRCGDGLLLRLMMTHCYFQDSCTARNRLIAEGQTHHQVMKR